MGGPEERVSRLSDGELLDAAWGRRRRWRIEAFYAGITAPPSPDLDTNRPAAGLEATLIRLMLRGLRSAPE